MGHRWYWQATGDTYRMQMTLPQYRWHGQGTAGYRWHRQGTTGYRWYWQGTTGYRWYWQGTTGYRWYWQGTTGYRWHWQGTTGYRWYGQWPTGYRTIGDTDRVLLGTGDTDWVQNRAYGIWQNFNIYKLLGLVLSVSSTENNGWQDDQRTIFGLTFSGAWSHM